MKIKSKAETPSGGELQVIGAGLPRTGTMSLQAALEMLGFGPCHHFKPAIIDPFFPYRESRNWQKALATDDGAERRKLIKQIYTETGCRSAVDYPTSAFIEDLVEIYPDAKFVHGVRTSASAWRKSWNSTLNRIYGRPMYYVGFLIPHLRLALLPIMNEFTRWDQKRLGATLLGEESDTEIYTRHNEFVRRVVPQDRLLEFEPKMGWRPLCEFLNVPVPTNEKGEEVPYPHVNDTKTLSRGLNIFLALGVIHWALLVALLWWASKAVGWRI